MLKVLFMKTMTKILVAAATITAVVSCTTTAPKVDTYKELSKEINEVKEKRKTSPIIERVDAVYSQEIEIPVYERYKWLNNRVSLNLKKVPFSRLAQTLANKANSNLYVKYQPMMDMDKKVTIEYEGDLYGAFEYLKSKTGYQYSFSNRFVSWKEFVTKSFPIKATIGSNSMRMGVNDEQEQDTGFMGSGQQNASSLITKKTQTDEYTNKEFEGYSPIDELEQIIADMVSSKGEYKISRSTNTLIVTDTPNNVDEIELFVDQYNEILTTQVLLSVKLVEVSLFEQQQYGINWNVVKQAASGEGLVSLNSAFGANGNEGGANLSYQIFESADSDYAGSKALIDALQTQGNVSLVQHPDVMTLSNRVANFSSTDFRTFLESSEVFATADVGTSSKLNPGVLNDGFVMHVLPKVVGNQIMFDLSILFTSSDRVIGTIESGGSLMSTPSGSVRRIVQQGVLRDGQTLVLTGYRESIENKTDESLAWIPQSTGKNNSTKELLLVVTPKIVRL
jgi:type IVB pilus formation R64 PilN family outer membrane protein